MSDGFAAWWTHSNPCNQGRHHRWPLSCQPHARSPPFGRVHGLKDTVAVKIPKCKQHVHARLCARVRATPLGGIHGPTTRLRGRCRGAGAVDWPDAGRGEAQGRRERPHPPARAVVAPPRLRSFPPFFSAPLRHRPAHAAAGRSGSATGGRFPADPCAERLLSGASWVACLRLRGWGGSGNQQFPQWPVEDGSK